MAARITEASPTRYEKVLAIERWLMQNTEYTLDIPPLPPGKDALDTFLFEDRKGFCEQIATAEVILLRLAGVPARLVSGYVPGQRSFFSGVYEVRGSDAHTWTEIYYPGIGWVESDPTYVVPKADSFSQVKEALDWVKARYETLPAWARTPFSAGSRFARGMWHLEPVAVSTAAFLLFSAAAWVYWFRRRKQSLREAAMAWEERMLKRLEAAAAKCGVRRDSSETVREFAFRLQRLQEGRREVTALGGDIGVVAENLDRQVYSRHPLDEADRRSLEDAILRLESELEAAAKSPSGESMPTAAPKP